ncbi:hypothetical protein CDO46_22850 [Pigmentiphaga sp. NML030171]|uniref:aldo/keto reductase n=1 Tax=Pigmentiphaga sp. NML030171 TaxID=2008676 RepID=UPI000B410CA2|nr:aldo/keto reductase [Pigmentiphaga sp. NML030171]OVZ59869.1 hypothetical protein CDO46_22850 [Pigmentiphaga sp. NML030171]
MPRTLVVIQSRLSSSRLPGKALLTLAGRPVAVLCAQRAGSTGLPVLVATSDDPSDDGLAMTLSSHGIACHRGSLEDVLGRMATATSALDDDDRVVRLTADNVFPDGTFIDTLLSTFANAGVDYLGTSSPDDGLPYGMSAEVFTARALRKAAEQAKTAFDREHVTPYIRRHMRMRTFQAPDAEPVWRELRCTLDTFDDYLRLLAIFTNVTAPETTNWRDLVQILVRQTRPAPIGTLFTLGTAQLGLAYGIANTVGQPTSDQTRALIHQALELGVNSIDTARAYGLSEARLGVALERRSSRPRVITKLSPLAEFDAQATPAAVRHAVRASIFESCHALRQPRLDTVLLHRWAHRTEWEAAAWNELLNLKNEGIVGTLGVSVSGPEEAREALRDENVSHIQCPVNLLDWRWRTSQFLAAVADRPDVEFFARSVYLQGLLLLPPSRWPRYEGAPPQHLAGILSALVSQLKRENREDLCLAYVRGLPWIKSLVIGLETPAQLHSNVKLFRHPPLNENERSIVERAIPTLPDTLLNPAKWVTS